jgi:hypothetical protein
LHGLAGGVNGERLEHVALEHLDLGLDFFELGGAVFDQLGTARIRRDRGFERQLARFHLDDQLCQFGHGLLERFGRRFRFGC